MPKPKILVVDDDPDLLRALTAASARQQLRCSHRQRWLRRHRLRPERAPVADHSGPGPARRRRFRCPRPPAKQRRPFRDSGNRTERPRSAEQRRKSPQGRRRGIFPEARRQRRADERNPGQPRAGSRKVRGLAVLTGQGQELDPEIAECAESSIS